MFGGEVYNTIGQFNADGSLDTAFTPEEGGGIVYCLAVQGDGKILAGGLSDTCVRKSHTFLERLHADGSLDDAFNPEIGGNDGMTQESGGVPGFIYCARNSFQ